MWLSPRCGSARTCGHAKEHEHDKLANERVEWLSPHCGSARICGHAKEDEHDKLADERDEVVGVQHAILRKNDEVDKVHSSTR